jgi:hypothetical protein
MRVRLTEIETRERVSRLKMGLYRLGSIVAAVALALPAVALADDNDSADCTYNPTTCNIVVANSRASQAPKPRATVASGADGLPFTGTDVSLLLAGGGLLGLLGFAMRRAGRDER